MNDLFRKYEKCLICLLLSVSIVVLFWQVQYHDFILYDDNLYVTENGNVLRGLSREGLTWALTATDAGFWHPLTWLSLMLDCQLYRLNAGGYHWTNVLLHVANSILLFLVLSRMTGAVFKSAFVAALFALHPLHVESVAWVSQRKDVLSTFFWVLTMSAYVYYTERPGVYRYLPIVLFYVLGLMSKPMVVTLPLVLLLLDYWPLKRFPSSAFPVSLYRLILEKIPLFILAAGLTAVTFYTEGKIGALKSFEMFPVEVRTANAIVSYVGYIWKTVWPINLAIFYPHSGILPWWQIVPSALMLVSITFLVFYNMKRYPFLVTGWFWYILTLSPVIGLVQIGGHGMADRYTYIPLIGLFVVMVWGVSRLWEGWQYGKIFAPLSSLVVLSVLMVLTWFQVQHWRDSISLFQHALHVTEKNYVVYNNLGAALFHKGNFDDSMECFKKALQIKPDYADAYNNMGLITAFRGKSEEAMFYYTQAIKMNPNDEKAHNNLANVLADRGSVDEAIQHYKEALRIRPDYADAHNNLGISLARQNHFEAAAYHFKEAMRITPGHIDARDHMKNLPRTGNRKNL
jgi:Tfp pilus assembly protein PilF